MNFLRVIVWIAALWAALWTVTQLLEAVNRKINQTPAYNPTQQSRELYNVRH